MVGFLSILHGVVAEDVLLALRLPLHYYCDELSWFSLRVFTFV